MKTALLMAALTVCAPCIGHVDDVVARGLPEARLARQGQGPGHTARTIPLQARRVDVGGHTLYMLGGGEASARSAPTVVLEAGFGNGVASWSPVQPAIAEFTTVVSYDRAGSGQSEPGPTPRSAKQIARELHRGLQKAGFKPPYVLVGHSLGGPFVRVFASTYPNEVVGMVLIDPSQEAFYEWTKAHAAPDPDDHAAELARLPRGPRDEYAAIGVTYGQARAATVPRGIPVTLLTPNRDLSIPADARAAWSEKQREWIGQVSGATYRLAEKSGHFIQAQEPDLVVDAIRRVVDHVQGRRPAIRPPS